MVLVRPLSRIRSIQLVLAAGMVAWPLRAHGSSWTPVDVLADWPGLVVGGVLVGFFTYLLVRGRYRKRERDFVLSASRLQFLFDHAPVALLVADMRPQRAWLQELRAQGVGDIRAYLRDNPEVVKEQFARLLIVAVNRCTLVLSGLPDLEAVCERFATLEKDFRDVFNEQLAALWEGRTQLVHDVELHREDGQVVSAVLHWTIPMEGAEPDYSRAMSVFTDMTDLRRTQAQLRQSEDRWQLAVQGINAGIWEIDFESQRFFVSERSREMLGYEPGDMEDSREAWEALIHSEDRARVAAEMQRHLAGLTPAYRVEHRLLCQDGRYRWVLACGLAQFDSAGRPVRFVGTHSDIQARKAAEEELASERERLKVTLRAMVEAVVTANREGVVSYMNDAAEKLIGWSEGEAIGRKLTEICPLQNERSREPIAPPHLRALSDALVVELPPSTVVVHRSGGRSLVEGRCAPIRDSANAPAGVVLVLRDVTESAKLEAEMLRATKLESVGVLAGGIAHDFNNLLTVIMGNITLAMLDTTVQQAGGQWLGEAEKGLLRARDLTQQLLTFAKGGAPIRSAVQLAEVVKETAQFTLHGSKVKCEYEIEPDLWTADVDKGQIGQVVQNLVLNAVQAMPKGGVMWVNLANDAAPPARTGLSGAAVRLTVADTGAGIRPDHLSRIFDPYFTTKHDGSGLGLATVYAVVRKHGGFIEVESEIGRGTRFRIWLPAARTEGAQRRSTNNPFREGGLKGRVLLMDDEAAIRTMATHLLKRIGFVVETVDDGAAAVEAYFKAKAEQRGFDLVIMDLTVPGGVGGLEAMRRLQEIDPKVVAIVSSGYSSDPVMSDYRAHGFAGMIPKPYRVKDFTTVIQQVLGC